jgi:type IV secretion system protein VirB11
MSHPPESQHRVLNMLTVALGPVGTALQDPTVIEIMVNPDGRVWVERLGEAPKATVTLPAATVEHIIRLVASSMGLECHADQPALSAPLPGSGARFQGMVPPITAAPSFVIRKKAVALYPLAAYVAEGSMTAGQAALLRRAVEEKRNILIAGGTGSGKTTLCNALLAVMATLGVRILTLEDTAELHCPAPNHLALYTKEGVVTMRQLVKLTLRCRPDRIILGEVRDGAVHDLFNTWNSGHPGGLCTIHAETPLRALRKLEQYALEVVLTPPCGLIADVVDVIVCMQRTLEGRKVTAIAEVRGYEGGQYLLTPLERTSYDTRADPHAHDATHPAPAGARQYRRGDAVGDPTR